ncbi:Glutaminyl-tRNA synthetase [Castellaniella defragrans 65Phen]|uniref:Glutamine--tRNA ligase n=1 Tax=Castellaniella defragrans (strain DSM 12143 / CCUG 39792 / 65Phen) TaxID=1437824 RepID=W8X572_CASD6|nr:Glutaminyl-tRNA synthetase [Castellaniella defragrans 65Phen]
MPDSSFRPFPPQRPVHPRTMTTDSAPASNFLRTLIDNDLKSGRYQDRQWAPPPSPAEVRRAGAPDPARIRTRFPPEPNGYLHIGHAKSICLNFGLARDYQGICHLRFDDTNPEKEEDEYVHAIIDMVRWLGFDWTHDGVEHCYYASDYFETLYRYAEALVRAGHAYVDEQSADEMRATRGTLTEPGTNSPWRDRPADESLALLRDMRAGKFPDGRMALRARIDMASPNINLRDPVLYRIRHATHHRTGDAWCIYPMYAWAHPVEDALEGITHSICTLEFEDQRPFYDWILERLAELGELAPPLPRQHEFARLNLSYVVTSKRKLRQLVLEHHVDGWDDPRLPTLAGLRRRGYTPGSIRLFCERLGVSKADSRIDYGILEQALRDDLDPVAARAVAVLDPLKLVITNFPEGLEEPCSAPLNPHEPDGARRSFPSRASSGSSATTSARTRRRNTSACSRAIWCGSSTATSCAAPAASRTTAARSSRCTPNTCRTRAAARRARTPSRSRAPSPGSARPMPCPPRSACTTGCSPSRTPTAATAISCRRSIPTPAGW